MSSDDRRSLERRAQGLGDKPALLIVDVINGFTDPTCPLGSEAASVVEANCQLMAVFHKQNLPVSSPPWFTITTNKPLFFGLAYQRSTF